MKGQKIEAGELDLEIEFTPEPALVDVDAYNEGFSKVVDAYNEGRADTEWPADLDLARSFIAPGTGAYRDFSYIAPEIPEYYNDKCTGCMECVTECPDTAILAKVVPESALEAELAKIEDPETRERMRAHFAKTRKFYDLPKKKGHEPGMFSIFIDPTKCKGCAECVEVCDDDALAMIEKGDRTVPEYKEAFDFFKALPDTPSVYINERTPIDIMLTDKTHLYVGGAGSCAGCGEATALRMMAAANAFYYGREWGIVAATGCNTVYSSTYPYNPFLVPWTNSLFENAATDAMGIRLRWDQMGWHDKKLWVVGGDGAMFDIGFQALSRMLASGMNINVLVLDTQVYSNTGGQASTATYLGQETKMSAFGKVLKGKTEQRKEIGEILMMHPDVFVAQTTAAHFNHFYKAIFAANEYEGPSVVIVYTTCQPEHGVGDSMSSHQARLAVLSRTFPVFIHDPRKGERLSERLDLKGNPAIYDDWYIDPKTKEPVTFVDFARSEGRFAKHFDKDGNPDDVILAANEDRLRNWRRLQELAGILDKKKKTA